MDRLRHFTQADHMLMQLDTALRTLLPRSASARRPSPAQQQQENTLNTEQSTHAAGLMRINHSGEVCAQALYQGQALTARLPEVRVAMEQAAAEEVDHLVWCEERLRDLGSRPSLLNPVFYGLSFGVGALAGLVSDRVSLGFVAETEHQVCQHLESHLKKLPPVDQKSKAILQQMRTDEAEHAQNASAAGAMKLPMPVRLGMQLLSKVMTYSTYRV